MFLVNFGADVTGKYALCHSQIHTILLLLKVCHLPIIKLIADWETINVSH